MSLAREKHTVDAVLYQREYETARTRLLRHYCLCVVRGKAEAQAGRTRCQRCPAYASERTKKWLRKRATKRMADHAWLPFNITS